jgi:hypothetical protein
LIKNNNNNLSKINFLILVFGLLVFIFIIGCEVNNNNVDNYNKNDNKEVDDSIHINNIMTSNNDLSKDDDNINSNLRNDINNIKIEIIEFKTNKEIYSSREELNAEIIVKSNLDFDNIVVRFYGISVYSRYYIQDEKEIFLVKGENNINFNVITPSCTSGCGGVYPGPYDLFIDIFVDNEKVSNTNKIIELTR